MALLTSKLVGDVFFFSYIQTICHFVIADSPRPDIHTISNDHRLELNYYGVVFLHFEMIITFMKRPHVGMTHRG